jgi:hypothetical protein
MLLMLDAKEQRRSSVIVANSSLLDIPETSTLHVHDRSHSSTPPPTTKGSTLQKSPSFASLSLNHPKATQDTIPMSPSDSTDSNSSTLSKRSISATSDTDAGPNQPHRHYYLNELKKLKNVEWVEAITDWKLK